MRPLAIDMLLVLVGLIPAILGGFWPLLGINWLSADKFRDRANQVRATFLEKSSVNLSRLIDRAHQTDDALIEPKHYQEYAVSMRSLINVSIDLARHEERVENTSFIMLLGAFVGFVATIFAIGWILLELPSKSNFLYVYFVVIALSMMAEVTSIFLNYFSAKKIRQIENYAV